MAVALIVPSLLNAAELPRYFYKHLEGTINDKYPIVMDLERLGDRLAGSYCYARSGQPIALSYDSSISGDGAVVLHEIGAAPAEEVTGSFTGRFVDPSTLSGVWRSPDGTKSFPFSVVERYPAGSVALDIVRSEKTIRAPGGGSASLEVILPRRAGAVGDDPIAAGIEMAYRSAYADTLGVQSIKDVPAMAEDFAARFADAAKGLEGASWGDSFEPRIVYNAGGIVSIAASMDLFEGGAYPNNLDAFRVYSTKTGRFVELDDVLAPGYEARLNAMGVSALKKAYKLRADDNLSDAGLLVDDESFAMTPRFIVARGGLLFRFSQGEIGPHALGAADLFFTYRELAPLIRKDGPLGAALRDGMLP